MSQEVKSIFKSSFIIGGSQFIVALINMVRAKALAIFLGPAGTGIIGLYTSATSLVNSVSALGLPSSAVRQISKANATNNEKEISETIFVYRVLIFFTSLLGSLFILIFAKQISEYTFNDSSHTTGVRWVSILVLTTGISVGQSSLLQGLRRIADLAKMKIFGALIGAIFCIIIIYFLREDGVIPFLLFGGITSVAVSWYYTNKISIKQMRVSFSRFKTVTKGLLEMGLAFLFGSIAATFSGYYSRVLISDELSTFDLGLYTASWTLSAIYIQFVLSAMSADFYPNLVGKIDKKDESISLINNQIVIGVILSLVGILSIIAFSEFFITLLYSSEFKNGTQLLMWMTAGMAIKVFAWPLGFIIIAKGKSKMFILIESIWVIMYLGFLSIFVAKYGLVGAGIAFVLTYAIYAILLFAMSRHLLQFKFTKQALQTIFILMFGIVVLISAHYTFEGIPRLLINFTVCLLSVTYSFYAVQKITGKSLISFVKEKINKK